MPRRPEFPKVAERIRRDYPAASTDALPGERDLARRYGVSRPTVSKALALLTKQGVLMRHAPGASSVTNEHPPQPTTTVVTYVGPVAGSFHAPLLLALLTQASDRGYYLRVIPVPAGDDLPEDVVPRLAGSHAVIGGVPNVETLEQACPRSARFVLVGLSSPDPSLASRPTRAIHVDVKRGMEAAIQYARSQRTDGPVWIIDETTDAADKMGTEPDRQGQNQLTPLEKTHGVPTLNYVSMDPADRDGRARLTEQLATVTPPPAAFVCASAALALVTRDIARDLSTTYPMYRCATVIGLGHDPLVERVAPEIVLFDFAAETVAHQALAACFLAPPPHHPVVIAVHRPWPPLEIIDPLSAA